MWNIELRTWIGKWWSVEGKQVVFACVWELEAFVSKLMSADEADHQRITSEQYLQAFSRIDTTSQNFAREGDTTHFQDEAILVYNWDVAKLVKDILTLSQ